MEIIMENLITAMEIIMENLITTMEIIMEDLITIMEIITITEAFSTIKKNIMKNITIKKDPIMVNIISTRKHLNTLLMNIIMKNLIKRNSTTRKETMPITKNLSSRNSLNFPPL